MKKTVTVKTALSALLLCTIFCGCSGGKISVNDVNEAPPASAPRTLSEAAASSSESSGIERMTSSETKPDTGTPEPASAASPTEEEITVAPVEENLIVLTAQTLLGITFTEGGSSPSEGFDNSGLIYYVLRENGYVNCPRSLYEQTVMGNMIGSISELRSGDLVFFSESGEKAQFGGIYIGGGIMISCRMPGEKVMEFNITSNYYKQNFFKGIRVL